MSIGEVLLFAALILVAINYGPMLLLKLADKIAPNDPYTNGWNWAVTSLEEGIDADVITEVVENGKMFDHGNPFDRGAEDALRYYAAHGTVTRK